MAKAAQEVPKTQVDGTEEILTGTECWEPPRIWSTFKFPSLFQIPRGVLDYQSSLGQEAELPRGLGEQDGALTGDGSVAVRGDCPWVCGSTGSTCRAPQGLLPVVASWESPCGQETKRSCGFFRLIPALPRVLPYWLERVSPDWSSQGGFPPPFGRLRLEKQIRGGEAAPAHSGHARGEFPGKQRGFGIRNVNYGQVKLIWDLTAPQLGCVCVSLS